MCIDRGFAKPKEARYRRMQNDFPAEEKLPTEGGIKIHVSAHTLCRWSGTKDRIVYTGLIFKSNYLTQRECMYEDNYNDKH